MDVKFYCESKNTRWVIDDVYTSIKLLLRSKESASSGVIDLHAVDKEWAKFFEPGEEYMVTIMKRVAKNG